LCVCQLMEAERLVMYEVEVELVSVYFRICTLYIVYTSSLTVQ
jgi:hypothetical protein